MLEVLNDRQQSHGQAIEQDVVIGKERTTFVVFDQQKIDSHEIVVNLVEKIACLAFAVWNKSCSIAPERFFGSRD